MDAAPEPDYKTLYERAVEAIRLGAQAFQEATDIFHQAVQDIAAAYPDGEAEGEAGADADEDGDEAGYLTADNGLEGCGICTQFTPCPNPGIGCYVNPPAPDPCTACDDSDDEYCGLHSEGGVHACAPCPPTCPPDCPCCTAC